MTDLTPEERRRRQEEQRKNDNAKVRRINKLGGKPNPEKEARLDRIRKALDRINNMMEEIRNEDDTSNDSGGGNVISLLPSGDGRDDS